MHTDFVENMLTVHKKYRDLIQEVFQADQVITSPTPLIFLQNFVELLPKTIESLSSFLLPFSQAFVGALDKACTSVINHREPKVSSKSPELLARYITITIVFIDVFSQVLRLAAEEVEQGDFRERD